MREECGIESFPQSDRRVRVSSLYRALVKKPRRNDITDTQQRVTPLH